MRSVAHPDSTRVTEPASTSPRLSAAAVASGRSISEPRLAPDASFVVFSTRGPMGTQLVRIDLDPTGTAGPETVLTVDPPPVGVHPTGGGSFALTPDGTSVLYASRRGLAITATAGGVGRLLAEPVEHGASIGQPSVSADGRWVAAIENRAESDALLVVDLLAPAVHQLAQAPFMMDPEWGPGGWLAWHEWSPPDMAWHASRIVRAHVDVADGVPLLGRPVIENAPSVGCGQPRFSPTGDSIAWVDDALGFMNVTVGRVDRGGAIARLEEPYEHMKPTWGPGQRSYAWSPDSREIAFVRNEAGFGRLVVAALAGPEERSARTDVGKAWHYGVSWARTPEGVDRIVSARTGATTPTQLVVYDRRPGAAWVRRVVARGGHGLWEAEQLVEPELMDCRASDGTVLHARLFRARGVAGPRPAVVSMHGGPTGQTTVDFVARTHWWVSRGWAVLVPDPRGSTGWGRHYWEAMDGRWGELDVSDTIAIIEHAIDQGVVERTRVIVSGGSSGGYTTLALMAERPDLVQAGIALYPVVDHVELARRTHRFERHYSDRLIGPLPEALETYVARSPITFAERIAQPLLMLHGAVDEVIPVSQPMRLHQRLTELGRPSTLHVYEGEGHGWSRPETTIDEMTRTEAFLAAHGLDAG